MLAFIRMMFGPIRSNLMLALVLPAWLLAKARIAPGDRPKRQLLRLAFRHRPTEELQAWSERFLRERMHDMVRPAALRCIRDHLAAGDRVIIVTAACSLWVGPWCRENGLELIATELEHRNGRSTGRLLTPNCKGPEKVRRIAELCGRPDPTTTHAYGDTPSDRPMLALAAHAHYKPFRE